MRTRHTFVATSLVALLAVAGVTAAIAADPAQPPPPRIAFVANGRVPADALAAGPVAGQLGAPVYTTEQDSLPDATADALAAHNPELVIIMGGTVAISDDVVNAIAAATGLPTVAPTPPPTTGVVRAAGQDRFITATIVADLLGAYDPAYLGVDLQATDADLLDGQDSSAFLGAGDKAADADLLDGVDGADLVQGTILGARVGVTGSIVGTSRGVSDVDRPATGSYLIAFDQPITNCIASVTPMDQTRVAEVERFASGTQLYVLVYPGTNATGLAADRVNSPIDVMLFCP